MRTDLFVDGTWSAGSAGSFDVLDPSSAARIAAVARAGLDDLDRAITAAHTAQPLWAATAPRERSELLRRAFEGMIARRDEIAALIVREMGKSQADALAEVTYAAEFLRWFAEEAVRIDGELRVAPSGANRILTFRRPVGVALLLTPWNFPAAMATRKIGPALAAGCTVVLKPAEDTPLTALLLAEIFANAGIPDGVVNVLTTDQPGELVTAALADPRVRKLSFTGSTQVGRVLLGQAAAHVVNCSMELGGNAPFLVLDDADVDAAVAGAMLAKMRNYGQACTAANRFIVDSSVVSEFTSKLVDAMASVPSAPLVNSRAVDGVAGRVDSSGGRVLLGGKRESGPGFHYPPTVVTDVPYDSVLAREEVFGPVATILTVPDADAAVALANSTEMGLVAYVYTQDLGRGLRISERLEAGMVGLNRGLVSDPAAPFGGVKESGLGREGGYEGIQEYLETMYVATSW
ncbi:NAD-dependent succinate-semialdehyde dehydrogenase [Actinocrispum wychmicini]|uniref:Succinate-semialdehyde dehydrogenase/glutarate-semialdehyde dehydrogenase n=1 Tax=Actinocrispum wychmicini TaxID=1213861 RepID=A0A4R2JQJ9_9PSEU|nr:NAD-dependent succinate-semialdehyde dehydrogenase [Actinocrispum wychmicini]TCO62503.1 succinate-semialdehyde dehydrogenase/glutarate-semialdehyde dehydrogenase [Actinocrispum wychmicini]